MLEDVDRGKLDRRAFVHRGAALGLGMTALGALASPAGASSLSGAVLGAAAAHPIPGPPYKGGKRGGVGSVAWPDETVSYDPPLAYDLGGYYGLANFFRGLLLFDAKSNPQLDLASSMDISSDGKRYRFKLTKGVTFHNGREVTASDFKYTFERSSSKQIGSWVQGFLASVQGHSAFVAGKAKHIAGIRVVDKYTLELRLTKPDVTIPGVLATPPFYVLPQEELKKQGKNFTFNPVGTGPFKMEKWDKGASRYRAVRNPDYVYGKTLPYFDELDWQWNVPETLEYLRVKSGKLDATGGNLGNAPSVVAQLRASKNPNYKEWPSFSIQWFELNTTQAPFDDVRVRRAVNYAFNKKRLESLFIQGTGHFYPPSLLGYNAGLKTYGYDPEKAKSLLKQADAVGVELTIPILGGGNGRIEQLLQQDLQQVGFKVKLVKDQAGVYDLGSKLATKYPLWYKGWGMGLPDPSELVSSLIGTGAPSNYSGWGNTTIDKLGAQATAITNRGRRGGTYAAIEKILLNEAPFIFLGVSTWVTMHSEQLKNFNWEPVLYEPWDRFWVS